MKKLMAIITMIFLFGFTTIGNTAVIEMNFYDDINNRHQSLEFDNDRENSDPNGFKNVNIYCENNLHELIPQTLRNYNAYFSNNQFRFYVYSKLSNPENPWIYKQTQAWISSESINYLGYDYITELTPILLEEILNNMVGQLNFFNYQFHASQPNENGLGCSIGNTTLTPWNYKPSNVPIPPSILLFGSGLIGLVSFKKFRY